MRCQMLTHYNTVLTEQIGQRSGPRLLLGVGAIVVDAIRAGRHVVISDTTSSERILLDPRANAPTDRAVIRWHLNTEEQQG